MTGRTGWPRCRREGLGGARCQLSGRQVDWLRTEMGRGSAVHGWVDQRWTLARVATLIGRLVHVRYTPRGASYLLHRMGSVRRCWPGGRSSATSRRSLRDRPGRGRSDAAGERGVDRLRGRVRADAAPAGGPHVGTGRADHADRSVGHGAGRVSIAGLVRRKPGRRGRLFYRIPCPLWRR